MKKLGLFTAIFALVVALFAPAASAAAFKDVTNDFWAADEINRFADSDVLNGYSDGTFRPGKELTRAEGAIILARGLGLDTSNVAAVEYEDINEGHFAYNEIAAVSNEGFMQGDNSAFNPDEPLTRAQMAILLTKAFGFEGNQLTAFSDVPQDHYAYSAIDAVYANGVVNGDGNQSYRPEDTVTRAEFIVSFARAVDNSKPLSEVLKEIYANEFLMDSYDMEGSMNLGLTFPEELVAEPELAMLAEMFSNIQIDISGAYQKDPMLIDMQMDLTIPGDLEMKLSMPIIMTQEKMWMKMPQVPMAPLPPEIDGKYIEFDLAELEELSGQPTGSLDMELQTELSLALYEIMFNHFTDGFYEQVPNNAVQAPADVDVKKVIKFELTNENLQPFVEIFFTGFLPEFLELLAENPEYADALGIPAEELELVRTELAGMEEMSEEIVTQINQYVDINNFTEFIVVNNQNVMAYDTLDLDVTIKVEESEFGFKMGVDMQKKNINGTITIAIPDASDVITYEELLEIEAKMLEELEGIEDFEDVEGLEDFEGLEDLENLEELEEIEGLEDLEV